MDTNGILMSPRPPRRGFDGPDDPTLDRTPIEIHVSELRDRTREARDDFKTMNEKVQKLHEDLIEVRSDFRSLKALSWGVISLVAAGVVSTLFSLITK